MSSRTLSSSSISSGIASSLSHSFCASWLLRNPPKPPPPPYINWLPTLVMLDTSRLGPKGPTSLQAIEAVVNLPVPML